MKLGFLGDSITEGVGASAPEFNYVSQVGKMLGCQVLNYGIGGTRLARQSTVSNHATISRLQRCDIDFNLRANDLDKTLDRIFVLGGTNDYGHGDASFGNCGDTDCHTFHGAINTLFSTLTQIYGKEKVVIILPLKRAGIKTCKNAVTGKSLKEYVETIEYYAKKFEFKYIDMFNDFLAEPPMEESEFFTYGGLHPNDKGYKVIAEKICEFIKNDK